MGHTRRLGVALLLAAGLAQHQAELLGEQTAIGQRCQADEEGELSQLLLGAIGLLDGDAELLISLGQLLCALLDLECQQVLGDVHAGFVGIQAAHDGVQQARNLAGFAGAVHSEALGHSA